MGLDDTGITEFNSAIATLKRIDEECQKSNFFITQSRLPYDISKKQTILEGWLGVLEALNAEIQTKMTAEETKTINKYFKKIQENPLVFQLRGEPGNQNYVMTGYNSRREWIRRTDMYIRRVADAHGMLMPNKQGVKNALGNMGDY